MVADLDAVLGVILVKLHQQSSGVGGRQFVVHPHGAHHCCHCRIMLHRYNTIQYNFIAKCQYNCTRNVLWCQAYSSHIHSDHKILNYNNSK